MSACLAFVASTASAQQPPLEERLRAIDWFVLSYVEPREVCAVAGGDVLARFDRILTIIRSEYAQAFDLVEGTKEYAATMAAKRLVGDGRFRGPNGRQQAEAECIRAAAQMASAFQERRHDEAFKHLVELFSSPI